jgi:hypothetical protein
MRTTKPHSRARLHYRSRSISECQLPDYLIKAQTLLDLDQAKAAVLTSPRLPDSHRGYRQTAKTRAVHGRLHVGGFYLVDWPLDSK